jgi:hypothetical protein
MNNTLHTGPLLLAAIFLAFFKPDFAFCAGRETASRPGLNAALDRHAAPLGSIVTLTLDYELPDGAQLPEKPDIKGLDNITIVKKIIQPGRIIIRFLVDTLDVLKTNPLSLVYLDNNGNTQTVTANAVSLEVLSNLGAEPEEAQLKPIQDIISTGSLWIKYLPWGAGAAGILVVLAVMTWWYRSKRTRTLLAEIIDPPHLRAQKELESLVSENLFEKGEVKRFYFRFSEILRRYVGTLRGFPAVEWTTEEIAPMINNEKDRALIPLLRSADLVKFADTVPTPAQKDDEVERALAYIRRTAASPEATAPAATDKQRRRPEP